MRATSSEKGRAEGTPTPSTVSFSAITPYSASAVSPVRSSPDSPATTVYGLRRGRRRPTASWTSAVSTNSPNGSRGHHVRCAR
ncbi:hypothetical protein [Streptosporangium sp. NPDC049046]|uniref:hypothetical protein n=1 Tax=Streptosporangium sp. NPDC049046 TaxID=3155031 RepID=UPI0034493DB9